MRLLLSDLSGMRAKAWRLLLLGAALQMVVAPSGALAQGFLDDLGTHDPWSRLERQDSPDRDGALAEVMRTADRSACGDLFSIYRAEPASTGLRPALLLAFGRLRCRTLRAHLEAQALRPSPPKESRAAVLALGRLRDPRSLPLLETLAATGQAPEPAIQALRRYGDPALPALLRLARGGGAAGDPAITALTALGAPALGPILREGLASGSLAPTVALPALCTLEGARALQVLLPWLSHPEPTLRLATLAALERCIDARAIPALQSSLAEPALRPLASRLLADLGRAAAVSPIHSLLLASRAPGGGGPGEAPLARALGQLGQDAAVPLLAALIERGPPGGAGEALDALQYTRSARAARLLRRLARRGDRLSPRALLRLGSLLRGAATLETAAPRALGREADEALPELLSYVRGRDAALRAAALQTLGRLGDPRGLPTLVGALQGPSVALRRAAAAGLGGLDDDRAVAALIRALGADEDALVRAEAAWSLGRLGRHLAAEPLLAALADPGFPVALQAAAALGRLGLRPLGDRLARALAKADPRVRGNVALALGRLRYAGARARLGRLAQEDPAAPVRAAAARAIARLGGPRSRATLRGLLDREMDAGVSRVIELALLKLAGRARPGPRAASAPQGRWVDLRIERGEGEGVPYRAYVIHLTDGTQLGGATDADGNGLLEGCPPGVTSLELLPHSLAPRAQSPRAPAPNALGAVPPAMPRRP